MNFPKFALLKMSLNKAKHTRTAADLRPGESGRIAEIATDLVPLKLFDMGCLPGAEIELCYEAPFRDPMYFRIADYRLAIRRELASQILLDPGV